MKMLNENKEFDLKKAVQRSVVVNDHCTITNGSC